VSAAAGERLKPRSVRVTIQQPRESVLDGKRHGPLYALKAYTARVVRSVWGVTLLAFVLLVGGDRICCPDGCTDTSKHAPLTESVPHSGPHTCLLCTLGVEAPDAPRSDTPAELVSDVTPAPSATLPNGIPLSLDHPPRRA
jgi:hypothetical protein